MQQTEKSLPLAIGMNLLLPGAGYIYMGRIVVGLGALLLVAGIMFVYADESFGVVVPTWIVLNTIMALDMLILANRQKKAIAEATTRKCPRCAEIVLREAKICRFCNYDFSNPLPTEKK